MDISVTKSVLLPLFRIFSNFVHWISCDESSLILILWISTVKSENLKKYENIERTQIILNTTIHQQVAVKSGKIVHRDPRLWLKLCNIKVTKFGVDFFFSWKNFSTLQLSKFFVRNFFGIFIIFCEENLIWLKLSLEIITGEE